MIGEIGIVHKSGKVSKASDKRRAGILVGYADQHSKGTYWMFMLETHKISVTKDVTWLKMNIKEYEEDKRNTYSNETESTGLILQAHENQSTSSSTSVKDEDSSEALKEMNILVQEDIDSNTYGDENQNLDDLEESDNSSDNVTVKTQKLQRELKALEVNVDILSTE